MDKKVSLSQKGLTWAEIEEKLDSISSVTALDLQHNRIENISDKILILKKLRFLNLSNNLLTEIPPVLFRLPSLKSLIITGNQITTIPEGIRTSSISYLTVKYNQIQEVDFKNTSNLLELDLTGNQIREIRIDKDLQVLEELKIGNNPVKSLSLKEEMLPSLKKLHLFTQADDKLKKVSRRLQSYFSMQGNVIDLLKHGLLTDVLSDDKIEINLLKDPYFLSGDHLIHKTKFKQILSIIQSLQENGREYSEAEFRRSHNIITLSGSRGTGKTTLLRAIYNELNEGHHFKDMHPLEIIDPTLIEEKGHIFLNIITLIRQEVLKTSLSREDETVREWEKALKSLAGGLPQLDGIQTSNLGDWNDPQFVMFSGLQAVQSAIDLEKNFHKFVRLSLTLLKKEFFVLFFDDVDNDFAKGWPVLETLRKYLTSPQMIILISGDLDLFSYVVRKKQWKNFGKSLLKNEFDQENGHLSATVHDYPQMVAELESQYLIKLMSPRYRVTLDSVLAKLSRGERIMVISKENNHSSHSIQGVREFYQSYLTELWGIRSKMALFDYTNLFMSLPIRSQIEMMTVFHQTSSSPASAPRNAAKALTDIFYSELKSAEVDVWEMINEYGEINIYILRFLLETGLLDEGSQLYPKLNDIRLDASVTALGCVLTERFSRRPYEIFDYIIRISYLVSKSNWPVGDASKDVKEIRHQSIQGLVDHAYLLYDYGMRKIASLQSAYTLSFAKVTPSYEGLIPIYGLKRFAKDGKKNERMRIDQLFEKRDLAYTLAMIPTFAIQDSNHERGTYFSFYNILAAVGELLSCDASLTSKELHKLTTFRVYPSYFSHDETPDAEQAVAEVDKDDFVDEKQNKPLVHDFLRWRDNLEAARIKLPPFVLGRAMVRTQSSFTRIETSGRYVGDLIHRMLAVFLNAVLVEEENERSSLHRMRLSNPVGADDYLIDNIKVAFDFSKKTDETAEETPWSYLSYHLLRCPLIMAYMNPEFLKCISLKKSKYNIYTKLNKLRILGMDYTSEMPHKLNRLVSATEKDADNLVMLMKTQNIKKEQINAENYMEFVQQLFSNKRSPSKKNETKLLELIQKSKKW